MAAVAGFVAADWSVTRGTGIIDYIGDDHGAADPSYATVLEFYRGIMAFADDLVSAGDDEHDMTDDDSVDKSFDTIINILAGFTITDAGIEHLYGGSIIQQDDDTIWDGFQNFGNSPTIQIIQNGAVLTDDWWNNDPFGVGFGLNGDAAAGITHQFLLKVRDAGTDVDGRRLIGTTRNFGNTYAEFSVNGSNRGNNTLALSEVNDIFNNNSAGDVSGWVISNTEGFNELDITGDGADEDYYSQWDDSVGTGTNRAGTVNDIYEYTKWACRDGSVETLYGLSGELFRGPTHEIDVDGQGVTDFSAVEAVSWSGGTGQMLAVDDVNAASKMWIQLLTGVAPTDGQEITGGTSGATCDVNTTVTTRAVPVPFIGSSTGTNLIGAYGIGTAVASVGSSDQLFDLTNTQRVPPNNVTFTLTNLDATGGNEDTIIVGPEDGAGGLDRDQLSLNTTLSADNITSVVVSASIPSDTPTSGYIRVQDDNGRYRRLSYSSWSGSTFTIDESGSGEEDFNSINATSGNNVWIAYMDRIASGTSENFAGVNLTRTLYIKVRNSKSTPIKPFTSTAVVSNADASVSVGRISDA